MTGLRVAVATWSSRRAGGVERYVENVTSALARHGIELALFCETDGPGARERIRLPDAVPVWCAAAHQARALESLRAWRPDLIYAQGLSSPGLERALVEVAPVVFFAHAYHGACVAGAKTFGRPDIRACTLPLGPRCLLHYFPRRCGGRSPLTMVTEYRRQRQRAMTMRRYAAIVTSARHLATELGRNGLDAEVIGLMFEPVAAPQRTPDPVPTNSHGGQRPWRLAFVGRMDRLKGGELLLDAIGPAAAELRRPIALTMAGDGPERRRWEEKARRISCEFPSVCVSFPGWLDTRSVEGLLERTDAIAIPSLWPEPFGLVGCEAGRHGVPAVGFATGGIPEWLHDGVNGTLADANPPTPAKFARALVRCLESPSMWESLRAGSRAEADVSRADRHTERLLDVFRRVTGDQPTRALGDESHVRSM